MSDDTFFEFKMEDIIYGGRMSLLHMIPNYTLHKIPKNNYVLYKMN